MTSKILHENSFKKDEIEGDIKEIKERLQLVEDSNLANVVFNGVEKELKRIKKSGQADDYILDLLDCIFDVILERTCIDYETIFVKINGCIQKIRSINYSNSESNLEFDRLRTLMKRTEKKLKDISSFLKPRHEIMATDRDYVLLNELVFKIKDVGLFNDVVHEIPSVLLARNDCGKYFYENLVKEYINLVECGDQKNMIEILYYEIIIDSFLRKHKKNFAKINSKLINDIGKSIENVKRFKDNRKNKEKRIFFLEELRTKLKVTDLNLNEKIKILNKKYEKDNPFNGQIIFDNSISRVDLTNLYSITIDPAGSQALDQAMSLKKLDNGNSMLYVHLADPNSFIKEGSEIDIEARKRAYTIYVPRCSALTMLTEELCYDKCSLLCNGNKVAVTHSIELDSSYNVVSYNRFNSVIRVDDNFSFDYIDKVLSYNKSTNLYSFLKQLEDISKEFEKQYKRNRLKSNLNKVIEHIDNSIDINDLEKYQTNSQKIISNILLKVCELEATDAHEKGVPFIFRVQDKIDYKKAIVEVDDLSKLLIDRNIPDYEVKKMLKKTVFSKLNSAYYSDKNIGHDALGVECHAKITCPMGNYSAMVNQRISKVILMNDKVEDSVVYHYEDIVKDVSKELNTKKEINDNYVSEFVKLKIRH